MNSFSRILFITPSTFVTLLIIFNLISYGKYGLDFTVESFYLVWIANPFIYGGLASRFGLFITFCTNP